MIPHPLTGAVDAGAPASRRARRPILPLLTAAVYADRGDPVTTPRRACPSSARQVDARPPQAGVARRVDGRDPDRQPHATVMRERAPDPPPALACRPEPQRATGARGQRSVPRAQPALAQRDAAALVGAQPDAEPA